MIVEYTHMRSDQSSPTPSASNARSTGKFPAFTIWRYILREHCGPFAFAFVVIFFVLVIDLLVDIMDAILGKGLDTSIVLELFALNFAWMIALAVPMAVLVAVLMAFGRMANDNEIVALMAAGVSPTNLGMPVLAVGAMLSLGLVWFNNEVLPDSNYRARVLMASLQRRQPAIDLKDREGVFITDFPRHVLRIDRVHIDGINSQSASPTGPNTGSQLEGIVVYEYDEAGRDPATIITAATGTIELWRGGAVVRLTLHDGEMIQIDSKDPTRDLRTEFENQTIVITDQRRENSSPTDWRSAGHRNDRELSSAAMLERVELYRGQIRDAEDRSVSAASDTALTETQRADARRASRRLQRQYSTYINRYLVEVHKKYSIPVACIVFVLVGTPLGMMARGAGRTASVAVSLALFLMYWASLIGGEQLADRAILPPWIAMWGANIVVGACGFLLLFTVSHNVRIGSLLEALPRALEARRLRRQRSGAESSSDPGEIGGQMFA